MIYFKSPGGQVFSYNSVAEREQYGSPDLVEITESEVDEYLNPQPTYQQALATLSSAYQADVDKFNRAFAIAYLSDGPSQDTKQAAIRTQYEERKTQHSADVAALKAEYGIGGGV